MQWRCVVEKENNVYTTLQLSIEYCNAKVQCDIHRLWELRKKIKFIFWTVNTLGFTFGDVEIEEVAVEDGLDATSNDSNQIEKAFEVEAVNPVEEIESTVRTYKREIKHMLG